VKAATAVTTTTTTTKYNHDKSLSFDITIGKQNADFWVRQSSSFVDEQQ